MINRLIDTPYLSTECVDKLDSHSKDQFNLLIENVQSDPMDFLETLIVDPNEKTYDGIFNLLHFGVYFADQDSYQIDYQPRPRITWLKRNYPLIRYLEQLDYNRIEYSVFSHFTHKFDYTEDHSYNKGIVLKGIEIWAKTHSEDLLMLEEYLTTKCLDSVIDRMINIKRRFFHE